MENKIITIRSVYKITASGSTELISITSQTFTGAGLYIGYCNDNILYATKIQGYDDTALAARVTALENIPWVTYYTGSSEPSSSQGNNGDIYLQTEIE